MPLLLNHKAVIVTGAGRGLGREYAIAAAFAGAAVVVNDIDPAAAQDTANQISKQGGRATVVSCSVAESGTGLRLVEACLRKYGRLDGIVNNAGVLAPGHALSQTQEEAVAAFETNVFGVIECGVAAMRAMVTAGAGSIVNVVSGSIQGLSSLSVYGSTKAAVMSLTYGWALELAGTGVRVTAVSPLANTAMSDLMDVADEFKGGPPAGVAPVVVALLSDHTVQLNGQVVRFDGRRLGLVAPPQLAVSTEEKGWTAETVADTLGGPFLEWVQPLGLAASPPARTVAG